MRVKVVDIPEEGLLLSGSEAIEPTDRAGDETCWFPSPVEYSVELAVAGAAVVRVNGRISANAECECGRCLTTFPVPLANELRWECVPVEWLDEPRRHAPGEREGHVVSTEDMAVTYYRNGKIDVTDLIRQQVQLALSMAPVCREDCRGLCPTCGANLNEAPCAGHADAGDSSFRVLSSLVNRDPPRDARGARPKR